MDSHPLSFQYAAVLLGCFRHKLDAAFNGPFSQPTVVWY